MANWHEPHVSSTPPAEGSFDFVFDNATGTLTIVKLVGGVWTTYRIVTADGPVGPQGPIGPQGLQGATGQQGSVGPRGDPGAQGPPGTMGVVEGWHYVGTSGEPSFTGPFYFNAEPVATMRFRKNGDRVEICGHVRVMDLQDTTDGTMFVLPEGYRPAAHTAVTVDYSGVTGYPVVPSDEHTSAVLSIGSDGVVRFANHDNTELPITGAVWANCWFSLS